MKSETLSSCTGFCIARDGKVVLEKQSNFYYLSVLFKLSQEDEGGSGLLCYKVPLLQGLAKTGE